MTGQRRNHRIVDRAQALYLNTDPIANLEKSRWCHSRAYSHAQTPQEIRANAKKPAPGSDTKPPR